jgi:hypothetical protein
MSKKYLTVANLDEIESLRVNFNTDLSLRTINQEIKIDLKLEFENWLNEWSANAYRNGVVVADVIVP